MRATVDTTQNTTCATLVGTGGVSDGIPSTHLWRAAQLTHWCYIDKGREAVSFYCCTVCW